MSPGKHGAADRRPSIFTLVELLITIAIIAILASLLFPALRLAREKGYTIVCKSNLKQTGCAFMMYDSDYNAFPRMDTGVSFLPPYWDDTLNLCGYVARKTTYLANGGGCPTQRGLYPTHLTCYGMNFYLGSGTFDVLKHRKTPSQTMLVMDAVIYYVTPSNYIEWCHQGRSNTLFCDGHVVDAGRPDTLGGSNTPFWAGNY